MFNKKDIEALDDDKLAIAIHLLTDQIGKSILSSLDKPSNDEAWADLTDLLQDDGFCRNMRLLHRLVIEDRERDLRTEYFNFVHRKEFREAYEADNKPVPPDLVGEKGEGEND